MTVTGLISRPVLIYRITVLPFLIWLPASGEVLITNPFSTVSELLGCTCTLRFMFMLLSSSFASDSLEPVTVGIKAFSSLAHT